MRILERLLGRIALAWGRTVWAAVAITSPIWMAIRAVLQNLKNR